MDFKFLNLTSIKKLSDPKAAGDLNAFLEKIPQNAGHTVLIAGAIVWGMAAAFGLFTAIQMQGLTKMRAELAETKALKPSVPEIKNIPISKDDVEKFVTKAKESYRGLNIVAKGSVITITARNTSNFTEFREAIGHVQNGGNGWRVSLDKLCVGRECKKGTKLMVALKVNKVEVKQIEQQKSKKR